MNRTPTLLGPNGQPISSQMLKNKKADPPPLGEKYGRWGGPDTQIMSLPGGGAIAFDLSQLTLSDYRQMTDHYQINASLTMLTFLLYQMEWRVVCDDKKQRDFYEEQINNVWTPLVRSKATAFWAGHSPNILQWENDVQGRRVVLDKIKDLMPEDCEVNWKKVDGAGTHKINVYDGIKQFGSPKIPVDNSYWYPLLMRHGDYSGTKLLRSAFQPWFFSILVHLFANRYYERFGEPTPVGRAPYEDEIRYNGEEMRGNEAMALILNSLRSRATVVLPDQRTPVGDETKPEFDYQIEYLESQMRGADFERYMTRLDEEMSLALFTPILLMRTADVGSYNLGTQHTVTYQWMLNALGGDWKYYMDWYLLRPMRNWNFGENADLPKIQFKKMGAQNEEMVRDIVRLLIDKDKATPNLEQLAEMAGIDLKVARALTDPAEGDGGGSGDGSDPNTPDPDTGEQTSKPNKENVHKVKNNLLERINDQVQNAFRRDGIEKIEFSLGYQRQFADALKAAGCVYNTSYTREFYQQLEHLLDDMRRSDLYPSADAFMLSLRTAVDWRVDQLLTT